MLSTKPVTALSKKGGEIQLKGRLCPIHTKTQVVPLSVQGQPQSSGCNALSGTVILWRREDLVHLGRILQQLPRGRPVVPLPEPCCLCLSGCPAGTMAVGGQSPWRRRCLQCTVEPAKTIPRLWSFLVLRRIRQESNNFLVREHPDTNTPRKHKKI